MLHLPKRTLLSSETATAIRQHIEAGIWKEHVPSERLLCQILKVSRPTVRTALRHLANAGIISIHHGYRNRINGPTGKRVVPQSRLVAIISQQPLALLPTASELGIGEVQALLAAHGFETTYFVCGAKSASIQRRKIEAFMRENRVFCCVLLSVSKELQNWFANHAVPVLVLGWCFSALALPSLDVDYRAVCRHAAGVLMSKGHRRLALVIPNIGGAGNLVCEEGFVEAIRREGRYREAEACIIRHNGTAQGMWSKLDAAFQSGNPPSGLLVANHENAVVVLIYLLKRGFAVPDQVSLISLDQGSLLNRVYPPIAHYAFGNGFARRLVRLMLLMIEQGYLSREPNLIFPKFVPGATVREYSSPPSLAAAATQKRKMTGKVDTGQNQKCLEIH